MGRQKNTVQHKGMVDLVDDSFFVLRQASVSAWLAYYAGTLPFIIALLYFWTDMSSHAFAYRRIVTETPLLAIAFIWMKYWQSVFANIIRRELSVNAPIPPKGNRCERTLRIMGRQAIIHVIGLLLWPFALLLLLPFGWFYAFLQNVTVLDDGSKLRTKDLVREAMKLAGIWPRQNHFLIWAVSPTIFLSVVILYFAIVSVVATLFPDIEGPIFQLFFALYLFFSIPLSPFSFLVAINIAGTLVFIPALLNMLLGIRLNILMTSLTIFSPIFINIVAALAYCCVDPLVKTAYILRCYYAISIQTGEDLRSELGSVIRRITLPLLLAACLFPVMQAGAEETAQQPAQQQTETTEQETAGVSPISPESFDQALDETFMQREFAWRMAREVKKPDWGTFTFIKSFFKAIWEKFEWLIDKLEKLIKYLHDLFTSSRNGGSSGFPVPITTIRYVTITISLVCILGILFFAFRRKKRVTSSIETVEVVLPDLENEATLADALPEDAWLVLAKELMESGNIRLALRAVYLAGLAALAQCGMITIARFKSNHDYARELRRRHVKGGELLELFMENTRMYESVWYGVHDATQDLLERILANQERLRTLV